MRRGARLAAAFSMAAAAVAGAQGFQGACGRLVLPRPPTDTAKTFVRAGNGEFGAPRIGSARGHQGTDIARATSDADPDATAVRSVAPGKIAYARENGSPTAGYGNVVVVDHGNGCYSLFAHLAGNPRTPIRPGTFSDLRPGQAVKAGDLLGYFVDIRADMDSTGNAVSTNPAARQQVHFQLIEAPAGRGSAGRLDAITGSDGVVVDSGPLLKVLGYRWVKIDSAGRR